MDYVFVINSNFVIVSFVSSLVYGNSTNKWESETQIQLPYATVEYSTFKFSAYVSHNRPVYFKV